MSNSSKFRPVIFKNKIFQNILLLCFSVLFSLYLIEGILTIIESRIITEDLNLQRIRQAKKIGIPFDERSIRTVINDLRSQGIEAYPILAPVYFLKYKFESRLLPIGTISQKVIVLYNETGTFETFLSDEHGFHNPRGSWDEKKADILIIGDSFAMGANVKSGADIRSQLAIYGGKVVTIGMNGNGPLLTLAGLCEYGRYLKPKIVLWLYYELNDLEDLETNREYPLLINYLQGDFSQNLLKRQHEIDLAYLELYKNFWKLKNSSLERLKRILFDFLTLDELRGRLGYLRNSGKSQLPLFVKILQQAKNLTASWGGKLYFVYLPDYFRYFNQEDEQYALRSHVLATVKKLNLPIIDFHETIKKQDDPFKLFPLRVHGHFNEDGYRLLATTIMAELQRKNAAKHLTN